MSISTSPDDYARELVKQATARACVALGFKKAQEPVLECLADVICHYVEKVSVESLAIAEMHGRVQPGVQDTMDALEKMRPVRSGWQDLSEFAFADSRAGDTIDQSMKSSSVEGVVAKAKSSENKAAWKQPFPHVVPSFPARQKSLGAPEPSQLGGKVSKGRHVPKHLPSYPPKHTYKSTCNTKNKKRTLNVTEKNKTTMDEPRKRVASSSGISKSLAKIEDSADDLS